MRYLQKKGVRIEETLPNRDPFEFANTGGCDLFGHPYLTAKVDSSQVTLLGMTMVGQGGRQSLS
jgi:hypothetical protein